MYEQCENNWSERQLFALLFLLLMHWMDLIYISDTKNLTLKIIESGYSAAICASLRLISTFKLLTLTAVITMHFTIVILQILWFNVKNRVKLVTIRNFNHRMVWTNIQFRARIKPGFISETNQSILSRLINSWFHLFALKIKCNWVSSTFITGWTHVHTLQERIWITLKIRLFLCNFISKFFICVYL